VGIGVNQDARYEKRSSQISSGVTKGYKTNLASHNAFDTINTENTSMKIVFSSPDMGNLQKIARFFAFKTVVISLEYIAYDLP